MTIELDLINCSEVSIPSDYPRDMPEQANISNIVDTITDDRDIISPIIVFKRDDSDYLLLKGSRRLIGSTKSGNSQIPALIISNVEYSTAIEYRALLHLSGKELSPFEIAKVLNEIKEHTNLGARKIAALIGWGDNDASRIKVGNYLRILQLPPEVADFFRGPNALPITFALQLQRLIPYPDHMVWLAKKIILDGLSVVETHALINRIEKLDDEKLSSIKTNETKLKSEFLQGEFFDKIESQFKNRFGTKLVIKKVASGAISVNFKIDSEDKLKQILSDLNL